MNNGPFSSFLDNNGKKIEAHGGCLLQFNSFYYWYGEDRTGNNYIHCYRSADLSSWEDRGAIVTTVSKSEAHFPFMEIGLLNGNGGKINLERPKVIYDEKNKRFVLYAHYENGVDYSKAAVALAISSFPDHDFVYLGHYSPLDMMSRDCTLYIDDDGKGYFISASNENRDLHIYKLSEDYLKIESLLCSIFNGKSREAPALIKKNGLYYLLTSACTGWLPNQCRFSYSSSIGGPWSPLIKIGDKDTFHSQPSFVFSYKGKDYYMGDVWGGFEWNSMKQFDYEKSLYLCLELELNKDKTAMKLPKNIKRTRNT
jgi:hypothetical protein